MKDWDIVLKNVSAEEIPFALSELSALLYRCTRRHPAVVKEGAYGNTITLALNREGIPQNGYCIAVYPPDGEQRAVISGYDATALLYGCMDFCGRYFSQACLSKTTADPYYFIPLFSEDFLPQCSYRRTPRILRRGLWTWGIAVMDWRGYLENMARLKLNELILWNDFAPVNGREIVAYAHTLGIKLIWGYAWGWDTTMRLDTSEAASRRIVEVYEREYAPLGGDGIYFQSFTETSSDTLDGVLIARAAVEFVNRTASALLERHPDLKLQFGLHADSVKNHMKYIAEVDPRIEIIWENCGGFPYHACPDVIDETEYAKDFTRKLLSLRRDAVAGAVFKSMIQLDWKHFVHQNGPELLGCAEERMIRERLPEVRRIWRYISAEWLDHGEISQDILRLYAEKGNAAVYSLVEAGLFEREIPLPVALYAELVWDYDQDWQRLKRETLERTDILV